MRLHLCPARFGRPFSFDFIVAFASTSVFIELYYFLR